MSIMFTYEAYVKVKCLLLIANLNIEGEQT